MRVDRDTAALLQRVIILLNDKPRFGPRNRRYRFDSYSVAAEVTRLVTQAGYQSNDPTLQTED